MNFSSPSTGRALSAGEQLGRYELICPLGEGGMAAVWLANQRGAHGFNKRVALKTILPNFVAEPGFRRLFMDEARIASRIQHENVAQVLDLGEDQDQLFIVIEWIDGDSFRALERATAKSDAQIPHGIALRILADACAGLHAAHELCDESGNALNVVHRDISPQNILVSIHGATKVIDFGIAKARDRVSKETTPGIVRGKQHYMSPEQAIALPIDRRADVWAIGAIFYRLVTGRSPFEASNPMATLEMIRRGTIAEPLTGESRVHPAIREVIAKALSPAPSERFDTAAAMREALEAAMRISGVGADSGDVAAFAAKHLGARRASLQEAVRIALGARRGPALSVPEPVEAAPRAVEVAASEVVKPGPARRPSDNHAEAVTVRPGAYRIIDHLA